MGFAEKLNQWSADQSGDRKYGTKRREISAEDADAEPEEATQRQQRLHRAKRACIIHAKAAGVTQRVRKVAQSLNGLTQRVLG